MNCLAGVLAVSKCIELGVDRFLKDIDLSTMTARCGMRPALLYVFRKTRDVYPGE